MTVLQSGGCVIEAGEFAGDEGTRRHRTPISKAMGARDIVQTISVYRTGAAPPRRNKTAEEVLYVVRGRGLCYVNGLPYDIEKGSAVFVPPGSVSQIENTVGEPLEIVSVCCPEESHDEGRVEIFVAEPEARPPALSIREQDQPAIATGNRTFRLLVNHEVGATRVTQFAGVIPPGKAPMHHHTYEEAIYILEGEGRLWTKDGDVEFTTASSIYLPRGVSHSLENTGKTDIRLLGVFHPSGSPAVRYDD